MSKNSVRSKRFSPSSCQFPLPRSRYGIIKWEGKKERKGEGRFYDLKAGKEKENAFSTLFPFHCATPDGFGRK